MRGSRCAVPKRRFVGFVEFIGFVELIGFVGSGVRGARVESGRRLVLGTHLDDSAEVALDRQSSYVA